MRWGLIKAVAILLAIGGLGIGGWSRATHWRPSVDRYPLQGIDLPETSPPVEWSAVRAAGADFAYLVATSGSDVRAARFEADWQALPPAGLRRGAVHIYSLCQPAIDQANAFNTVVPHAEDALPPAIDIAFHDDCIARPNRAQLIADIAALTKVVEAHSGKPVLLRIARSVERRYRLSKALHRPLWEVANFVSPDYAAAPWRMWRASDVRRIDGIDGPVNWDVVAP